jgi:hypothetical protein
MTLTAYAVYIYGAALGMALALLDAIAHLVGTIFAVNDTIGSSL